MIAEQKVFGHIMRPATLEEYVNESNDYLAVERNQKEQFYHYEVRLVKE
jgi:hypothetical protein